MTAAPLLHKKLLIGLCSPAELEPDRTSPSLKLPPKCHLSHGAIYYVHRNKWIRLCDEDVDASTLYRALAEVTKPPPPRTVSGLLDSYIEHRLPEKRKSTQKSYMARIPRLRKHFGHMAIADLEAMDVAMFLEGRRTQGHGPGGNREMAVLSAAFDYGMRQGYCKSNPCRGVRRNKEVPRRRFIRDNEWEAAIAKASPRFRLFLCFLEMTGLRQGDARTLTWDQLTEDGIEISESKTGKTLLIEWSDELQALIWEAPSGGPTVFLNEWGRSWEVWGLQSAMRRLKVDWTLHDVRARAESIHRTGLGLMTRYKRARRITPTR